MSVTFLGTSAGQPTTKRGLSCVALVRKGEVFLFDCGEGSQIQFRRASLHFGRVSAIFITHMHGDHVSGLPGMLMSLQMAGRKAPLRIVGPRDIGEYIRATFRLWKSGLDFSLKITEHDTDERVIESEEYVVDVASLDHRVAAIGFRFSEHDAPGRFDADAARALGVLDPRLYGVLQRGQAVTGAEGQVIQPRQILGPPRRGKVFVYCADTRPCDASVALGREADLLVHESTYCDDRQPHAALSGHSTACQAADIGRRAQARRLVLTHFSPRYDNLDLLLAEARPLYETVEAARELVEMPI